jgi:predicted permease
VLTTILPHGLRSAVRHLGRSPGFFLLATLLLATGIGAVTFVYSVINGILIRPLPYVEADRLVGFQAVNRARSIVHPSISISDFRDLRERQRSLEVMGAYRGDFSSWQRPGEQPVQLAAALVTEDFFRVLGVAPSRGRIFSPEEFAIGSPRTVVLSHEAWARRFNRDPSIIGRVITLSGESTTVIAVMPPTLREPAFVEVWLPFPREAGENFARDSRYWVSIGRMRSGASLAQVGAETSAIGTNLARQFPATNENWSMTVAPLHSLRVSGVRASLWVLFGATALLLIVACLNLANLLLARGLQRLGEMAVRQALGATRRRLLTQVLWENFVIALPGGLIGVGLAYAAVALFAKGVPPQLVPRANEVDIDAGVLAFALIASLAAGAIAGVFPALQAARSEVGEVLKQGNARSGGGRGVRRAQRGLVAVQIGVAFVVLTGAALFWKTLSALNQVDPGFQVQGVHVMQAAPTTAQYETNKDLARYFDRLVGACESIPGVEAAAVDASAPFGVVHLNFPYHVVGGSSESANTEAVYHFVSPGFFKATSLPVKSGRAIDARDDEQRSAVAMVNETMARLISPDGHAIGRRLRIVPWLWPNEIEIVGITGDAREANLVDPTPPQLYLAQRQIPWFFSTLIVKLQPGRVFPLSALRDALQKEDSSLPVRFAPLTEKIALSTAQPRLLSTLFFALGGATLGFTLFGIYACISLAVTQRTSEYGLRMALGATPRRVMGELAREVGRLIVIGSAGGVVGTWLFGGVLRGELHGVGPNDPQTMAVTGLVLAAASLAAALVPMVRVGQVPPAVALRHS